MRVCIAATVVLLVIVALVAGNAVYVRHTTDALLDELAALPTTPDPTSTPADIAHLQKQLEKHIPWLGLSVSYTVMDRALEALISLEAHARVGDTWQYASTLAVLHDLISDLARLEKFSAENLW